MPGPLPLEQKRARGRRPGVDSGGRPLPDERAVVALPGADGIPPTPEHLLDHGRDRWRKAWTHARWLSPVTDWDVLVRLCEAEDMRHAMKVELGRTGFFIHGSQGQQVINPLVDRLRQLDDQITRTERECGLTPASRGTMGVGEVRQAQEPSGLEAVIAAHTQQRAAGE